MTFDNSRTRLIRLRHDDPQGRSDAAAGRWQRWGGPEDRPWMRALLIAIIVVVVGFAAFLALRFFNVIGEDHCALADEARARYEQALVDHDAVAQNLAFKEMRVQSSQCND